MAEGRSCGAIRRLAGAAAAILVAGTADSAVAAAAQQAGDSRLPGVFAVLEQARKVAAATGDSVWPEYAFDRIPVAIYGSDLGAVVIHHPDPPSGFRLREQSVVSTPVWMGPATAAMNANTAGPLGGAIAAFVGVASLSAEPSAADVALVLHEAGHAFQARAPAGGTGRWPTEQSTLVSAYPAMDPDNNAWGRLEGTLLREALQESEDAAARQRALEFLAVRRHRQARLEPRLQEFERHLELNEGLAEYFALRAVQVLTEEQARHLGLADPGAYGPRGSLHRRFLDRLAEVNVGGRGAARSRFYQTGAAQAFLLDRLAPRWKVGVERDGRSLQDALVEALGPVDAVRLREEVAARCDLAQVLSEEREAAELIRLRRDHALRRFLQSPGRKLALDLSVGGRAGAGRSFDPMNLVVVDAELHLHQRMLEIGFDGGKLAVQRPALEQLGRSLVLTAVAGELLLEVDGEPLDPDVEEPFVLRAAELNLGADAVELRADCADLCWNEEVILVRPAPPEADDPDLDSVVEILAALAARAGPVPPLPPRQFDTVDGAAITLPAAGEPVALVFFSAAGWAAPAHRFVRDLSVRLRDLPAAQRKRVVLVAAQCSRAEIGRFLGDSADLRAFQAIHDERRALVDRLGITRYPTVVWIDAEGATLSVATGGDRPDPLQTLVERLRGEDRVP